MERPAHTADDDDQGVEADDVPSDLTPDDPAQIPPDHDDQPEETDEFG